MTRLRGGDIAGLTAALEDYEAELRRKTGLGLAGLACRAAGVAEADFRKAARGVRAAVLPLTAGGGIIPGFADAVAGILRHLGLEAAAATESDAGGLAQAAARGSDILVAADDRRFVALRWSSARVVDNAVATGRGFGAALEAMAGSLQGRKALVVGCGPVGSAAAAFLQGCGACVVLMDRLPERARELAARLGRTGPPVQVASDLATALAGCRLIVEATPGAGVIGARHLHPDACVAAPGVPLGLTPAARRRVAPRLVHDPLQLGVATMAAAVLAPPGVGGDPFQEADP